MDDNRITLGNFMLNKMFNYMENYSSDIPKNQRMGPLKGPDVQTREPPLRTMIDNGKLANEKKDLVQSNRMRAQHLREKFKDRSFEKDSKAEAIRKRGEDLRSNPKARYNTSTPESNRDALSALNKERADSTRASLKAYGGAPGVTQRPSTRYSDFTQSRGLHLMPGSVTSDQVLGNVKDIFKGGWDKFTGSLNNDKIETAATSTFLGTNKTDAVKGYNANNQGLNRLSRRDRDRVIQAERNEAAKHVRIKGENVDPFLDNKDLENHNLRMDAKNNLIQTGAQKDLRKDILDLKKRIDQTPRGESGGATHVGNDLAKINELNTSSEWDRLQGEYRQKYSQYTANASTIAYSNPYNMEHGKSFVPSEGTNGYGLGFSNYRQASRAELLGRGSSFLLGVGSGEAILNSFGVMTATQKALLKRETSTFKKLMSAGVQTKIGAIVSAGFVMADDGDIGDFVSNQLSYAAGLQGWRVGTTMGAIHKPGSQGSIGKNGLATSLSKNGSLGIGRSVTGFLGGVTGFALGTAAIQGASWVLSDMTSNRSTIRQIAKDFSKPSTMSTAENRKTLTARQKTADKLSKSGLNDRSMLLGNEARILKNAI